MKRLLIAGIMAISGIAVAAPPCWACSCFPYDSPKEFRHESAKRADAVFFARVLSINGGDSDDGAIGDDFLRVKVGVITVYKGKNVKRFSTVRTNESDAACGYPYFEPGEKYTIFAEKDNGKMFTGLCSGNKAGRIKPKRWGLEKGHPPEE